MAEYQLDIATPDGKFYSGPCEELIVRGTQGDLAVLAGHAPLMTALVPCTFRMWTPDGNEREGTLDGGLLAVGGKQGQTQDETQGRTQGDVQGAAPSGSQSGTQIVTVLTTHAEWVN